MAASLNMVFLMGHLGAAPELKYSQGGMPIVRMRLATNDRDKDGQETVEWHTVIAFRETAENCAKFLTKGSAVHVEGSIKTHSWETDTGEKRYMTEIIARRVQFLDKRSDSSYGGGAPRGGEYFEDEKYGYGFGYQAPDPRQGKPGGQSTPAQAAPSEAQQAMPDQCPF